VKKGRRRKPRRARIGKDDTVMSGVMLRQAVGQILKHTSLDRRHDVPYLAGYSRDAGTIYIDKDLPRSFRTRGRRVAVDRYLILHEAVEKALLDRLRLSYQHAHQVALRAEQAAVRADGVSWRDYDAFMRRYIKEADDVLEKLPKDLDVKPYRDEKDVELLRRMQGTRARRGNAGRREKPTRGGRSWPKKGK
jgi:hypothetical protein